MYPRAKYELGKDDQVIIDAKENLAYRGKVLKACQDSKKAQQIYNFCRNDEDGMLYFMNVFGWIYEPRDKNDPEIPFVLFDFQEDLVTRVYDSVVNKHDLLVEKSRDMGATWCILYVYLYGWLFKGWDLRVGSRKQDYVYKRGDMAALMQKIEFALKRLPPWMLPQGFSFDDHITFNIIKNPEFDNSIAGEPTSPNFSVGSRQTSILLDEFSKWEMADLVWKNTADVTDSRIILGTPPESKVHKFARLRFGEGGIEIPRLTLHWRSHPLKDDNWYARQKQRRTEAEISKELDLSYEPVLVGRVYPKFVEQADIGNYPYNPDWPLYTFWDYGEGGPDDTAIIWFQYDPKTMHKYIVAAFKKNYQDIKFFAPFITGSVVSGTYVYTDYELAMIETHKEWKQSFNIGDPYNGERQMASGDTIKSLLREVGVYMNHKTGTTVQDRIRKSAETFTTLHINDAVDSGCQDFINSITEARWPLISESSQRTTPVTKPIHDWTSHFRTAYEYGIDYWLDQVDTEKAKPVVHDPYYNQYGTFYKVGRETITA